MRNEFKQNFICTKGSVKPKFRPQSYMDDGRTISYNKIISEGKKELFINLFKTGQAYRSGTIKNYYKDLCFIEISYNNTFKYKLDCVIEDIMEFPFISDEDKLILQCGGFECDDVVYPDWWT